MPRGTSPVKVDKLIDDIEDQQITVTSLKAWRTWLARNHTRTRSVWVVTWKASQGKLHVPMSELVDEALCWGWIDSLPRALDAERSMRRMSPRRPGSAWSRVNKARVDALVAASRMQPAGYAVIEQSKADGSWVALDAVETLAIPNDLLQALKSHPPASAHFDKFPRSTKRAILEWIANAKRPETRIARIAETADMAARNLRANQARQVKSTRS